MCYCLSNTNIATPFKILVFVKISNTKYPYTVNQSMLKFTQHRPRSNFYTIAYNSPSTNNNHAPTNTIMANKNAKNHMAVTLRTVESHLWLLECPTKSRMFPISNGPGRIWQLTNCTLVDAISNGLCELSTIGGFFSGAGTDWPFWFLDGKSRWFLGKQISRGNHCAWC